LQGKRLCVSLLTRCRGFQYPLHPDFLPYYVGISDGDCRGNQIDLSIRVSISPIYVFFPHGWDDYEWVDRLLGELEEYMDADQFLERLGGAATLTLLRKMQPIFELVGALGFSAQGGEKHHLVPGPVWEPTADLNVPALLSVRHPDRWGLCFAIGLIIVVFGIYANMVVLGAIGVLAVLLTAIGLWRECVAVRAQYT
jgi:hypothetical protein